jgi:hypothetical protein
MPAYFLDSSTAVKRYVREIGTSWVISLLRQMPANVFYVSRVTLAEVVSAFARRQRGRSLTAKQAGQAKKRFIRDFQHKFFKIEIDAATIERAAELAEKYYLRGYDAVQLAAALKANASRRAIGASALIFVCADNDLRNAAQSEGLAVDDPNAHS